MANRKGWMRGRAGKKWTAKNEIQRQNCFLVFSLVCVDSDSFSEVRRSALINGLRSIF